ncbi:hypothetical protein JB92DRAFT_2975579 [Gautieria morchelliformis]|nr:hypothetical protein JB92DRAFT_2975579 [Gautieria morchelliformis]
MSANLLRISFLITMCIATPLSLPLIHTSQTMAPLTLSVIRDQLRSHRPTVSSAVIMAPHKRHTRRHYSSALSVTRATYREGVFFDVLETSDTQPMTPGNVITSLSVEPRVLRPTSIKVPVLSRSTSVTATASISTGTRLVLSDAFGGPSFFHDLAMSQPAPISQPGPQSAILPAFVGGAIGAVLLAALALLVVRRRRLLPRGRSEKGKAGFRGWFKSDKKDGVIFIRVPPPSMPLKGILIRNPTIPPTLDDACSDRMSLTSSQMSALINKLPKSYDSGLEDGVLDVAREHGKSSPVEVATRIGPSQSDFLTNLFGLGHTESFSSDTSSASGESTSPPSLSPRLLPHSPPRSQPAAARYTAYELPPLTLMNPPKPTFPPAVASPTFSRTSGPRGHGLILTGDQSAITPSFAQWHHQRSMARGRDAISRYTPQF